MPTKSHWGYGPHIPKTWKGTKGWERKSFHRDNQVRILRGLKPKARP